MSMQTIVFQALFSVTNNILDKNWDRILDACAREAVGTGYDPESISNKQLSEIMAGKISETNFLGSKEDEFYLFCLDNMKVNWAERIKLRMEEKTGAPV